jgi:hypothetical protein
MKFFILLATMFISLQTFGASPYPPWATELLEDPRFNVSKVERGKYDFAKVGGAIGNYSLGAKIPANAIITEAYFENTVAFVDGGSGTVSIGCESTNDIYAPADITGNSTGDLVAGIPNDAIANFIKVESGCSPRVYLGGAAVTEGELNVFFKYDITLP